MGWAIVSVVGFALVTALVIALARSNTARWERHHRAAQAAVRARERASQHARVAALIARAAPRSGRRLPHPHLPQAHLPHPHLPHLPHVHLPAWVVDRFPHPPDGAHPDVRFTWRLIHLPGRRRPPEQQPHPDTGEPPEGTAS